MRSSTAPTDRKNLPPQHCISLQTEAFLAERIPDRVGATNGPDE